MTATVAGIRRYPVKGLQPEAMPRVSLSTGHIVPGDRAFAIAHGASHWNAADAGWRPKSDFVTLLKTERLARLAAAWDPDTGTLTVLRDGKPVARGDPGTVTGRTILEQFFSAFLSGDAQGPLKIASMRDGALTDVPSPFVSLINLASVEDLERVVRAPVDPARFRGNILVAGLDAWAEFDWIGREIRVGAARLKVEEPIGRCAATHVDPHTAVRDLNLLRMLNHGFGHTRMGVYATVVGGGTLAEGDPIEPA